MWRMRPKCINVLILAYKQHFRPLVRRLQDCSALWGKQKHNLVAHSEQSHISLWDKGTWGHKVLFASSELDLFFYYPRDCLCMEILMIEWAMSEGWNNNTGYDGLCRVPSCTHLCSCFLVLPVPPDSAVHSFQLKFISLSNSVGMPCGLVYSLNWPYPPESFVCLYLSYLQ